MSSGRRGGRLVVASVIFALAFAGLLRDAWGCASIPAPAKNIDAVDYRRGGGIDEALRARNDTAMDTIRTYARLVSMAADRYFADGATSAALCTVSDLQQWAQAKALLGTIPNVQAERERAAIVGGLAFAYLKTKGNAEPADRAVIEAWLDALASGIESGFGDKAQPGRRSLELAGFAALAVGAAIGNQDHWRFGREAYETSLAAIDPDGVLETVTTGEERLLFDQNIALGSLVMMAELAARQTGEDWYALDLGAIHRLADRVLDGLRDPSWFADRSGKNQFLPSGRDLAWIAFYARRFPARFAGRVPDGAIFQLPRLGGDLTTLAEKWVKN
jgi:poly(beta-D-mannuronate) lyase